MFDISTKINPDVYKRQGVVCEYSWKIVMTAKDDAEIDSMFDEMKTQCDALGIQQLVEWGKNQIETAKSNIAKYE